MPQVISINKLIGFAKMLRTQHGPKLAIFCREIISDMPISQVHYFFLNGCFKRVRKSRVAPLGYDFENINDGFSVASFLIMKKVSLLFQHTFKYSVKSSIIRWFLHKNKHS